MFAIAVGAGLIGAMLWPISLYAAFYAWNMLFGGVFQLGLLEIAYQWQQHILYLLALAFSITLAIAYIPGDRRSAVLAGVIAGVTMAAALVGTYAVTSFVLPYYSASALYGTLPPVFRYLWGLLNFELPSDDNVSMLVGMIPGLLLTFVLIAVISAVMALVFGGWFGRMKLDGKKYAAGIAATALLFLLVVPVLAYAGVAIGVIPHPTGIILNSGSGSSSGYHYSQKVQYEYHIDFELAGGPGIGYLDEEMPFIIVLDGLQASNQSAATANGLSVTVTPSEGLGRRTGSRVDINNLKPGTHYEVYAHFRDGVITKVYDSEKLFGWY